MKRFWRFIKRKIVWIPLIAIVVFVVLPLLFKNNTNSKDVITDVVEVVNLEETIPVTGQVISETDLKLSFNNTGTVKSIRVKVGDKVKKGNILATLNQGEVFASLTQAKGAVAAAKAKYQKLLDGYSDEEIALAEIALNNKKRDYQNTVTQQETLVKNAYKNVLNSTPEVLAVSSTLAETAPTITGSYSLEEEGDIYINVYQGGGGPRFSASGLVSDDKTLSTTPQQIGNSGLYIQFSSTNMLIRNWVITIPNKKAADYIVNYNAYQSALKTQNSALSSAQSLIDQKEAELAIKKSEAMSSDINLAKANILTAEGQLQAARARYENTIVRAPTDGTITKIDVEIGELGQAQKEIMILQDVSNMYLEANINEANISRVQLGSEIEVNFDAFGPDINYEAIVTEVDPSSTLIAGVVNYKITASIDQIEELKPGMTANMTIMIKQKDNVLVVPSRAIILNKEDQKVIRIITNSKRKKYKEVPIITGMEGDGGMIEITSGIFEGEEFVLLIKNK